MSADSKAQKHWYIKNAYLYIDCAAFLRRNSTYIYMCVYIYVYISSTDMYIYQMLYVYISNTERSKPDRSNKQKCICIYVYISNALGSGETQRTRRW